MCHRELPRRSCIPRRRTQGRNNRRPSTRRRSLWRTPGAAGRSQRLHPTRWPCRSGTPSRCTLCKYSVHVRMALRFACTPRTLARSRTRIAEVVADPVLIAPARAQRTAPAMRPLISNRTNTMARPVRDNARARTRKRRSVFRVRTAQNTLTGRGGGEGKLRRTPEHIP